MHVKTIEWNGCILHPILPGPEFDHVPFHIAWRLMDLDFLILLIKNMTESRRFKLVMNRKPPLHPLNNDTVNFFEKLTDMIKIAIDRVEKEM